ncbi:MAG: MHYT domain-containing protein [Jiangellaceae bacterium]
MGQMEHFSYGLLTPIVSYLMACTGAAIGLRCTVRALGATGSTRRNWLLMGATAIGSGIWTMHFIAMLGFGITGSAVRYDVPLTLLSLVVAIAVVGLGVFTVGYGRSTSRSLVLGGLGAGLGVATMHYTGMAAVQVNGTLGYNAGLVALSVMIAVAAATAALWIVIRVQRFSGAMIAALVMGVAVSAMHYTAMAALRAGIAEADATLSGATAMEFIFPLSLGMAGFLLVTSVFIAVSPVDDYEAPIETAPQAPPVEAPTARWTFPAAQDQQPTTVRQQQPSASRPKRQPTGTRPR